jgi:hypothetical protein
VVFKAVLITLAVLTAVAIAVAAAAPAGTPWPPQADDLQLDPVALSSAERAQVLGGKIVLRAVADPGRKGRTYEAIGTLPGTLDEVLAVILDYRHYHEFMPRVERIVVTDEGPMVSLVEQHLRLPLGTRRRYRLRYTARRGADGCRVDWVQVPWPEVPASQTVAETSGHWQVAPDACGALLAVYHVYTEPGHVPLGMTGLAMSLSKHDLPKIIEAIRHRLRPAANPPSIRD